ncbi:hypothetical protein OBBRIDRAFT_840363 [Obba rivulosa]|uniref:Uncharacterized protein n=1 Tax=Obba rivulosa TaxID=1052685 RepID=A0A8E2AFN6_9APHY|nr:hypothetical protein OBBRIDRAFT_840363 [Obba rivulosa]
MEAGIDIGGGRSEEDERQRVLDADPQLGELHAPRDALPTVPDAGRVKEDADGMPEIRNGMEGNGTCDDRVWELEAEADKLESTEEAKREELLCDWDCELNAREADEEEDCEADGSEVNCEDEDEDVDCEEAEDDWEEDVADREENVAD